MADLIPSRRDPRLDVFRGLALVMIYINHVPGTVYENFTSRNFGFSDAAEGFVLMSGIAAGLAYGKFFAGRGPYWAGVGRIWRRVWTLYQVHILTTVLALGIAAAAAHWFGGFEMMQKHVIHVLYRKPLQFLIGVPLLGHQLGYANILPLYAVLLAAAPVMLWAALRAPRLTLAAAFAAWALAGQFRLNLPNFPNPGGWFFNPLSWQLLFVIGLLTGIALKEGRRLLPVRRWLVSLAAGMLILALAVLKIESVGAVFGKSLWLLQESGFPFYITAFDKTYLSAPRLLHILALAYLLSALPVVRRATEFNIARPFALMGRNALPVFALGSVLCYFANAARVVLPASEVLDLALILGGIGLMLLLAWSKEAWRRAEARAAHRLVQLPQQGAADMPQAKLAS